MSFLQLKRGTGDETRRYTGPPGEITINETNWSLRVHDGKTPGGHPAGGFDSIESISKSPIFRNDPFLEDAIDDYDKIKKELLIRIKMMLENDK